MTTTATATPSKTPVSTRDKENNGGEPTPFVNLPSALKLGTPFFHGTRRQQGNDDGAVGDTARTNHTTPARPSVTTTTRTFMDTPANESVPANSFPDELPLQLFKERLSPRKSPMAKKETKQEIAQEEEPVSHPILETSNNRDEVCEDQKERQVRWNLSEEAKESKAAGMNECVRSPRGASTTESTLLVKLLENTGDISPSESVDEATKEPDSTHLVAGPSLDDSVREVPSQSDDFSAMIDALSVDFLNEMSVQQQMLETLSSGNTTDLKTESEKKYENITKLERTLNMELTEEAKNHEKLLHQLSEEHTELLARMEEIKSQAELSVCLAREEARLRTENAKSLLAAERKAMEVEKAKAVAEIKRQTENLLEESRKREDEVRRLLEKLQKDHSREIESELEQARKKWKHKEDASLSIQKAAVTQSLQREIFDIETELLETLDELDTVRRGRAQDRKELEAKISTLEQKLLEEQEKAQDAATGLQKEVEMFRIRLELGGNSRDGADPEAQDKDLDPNLATTVTQLQGELRQANEYIKSARQKQDDKVLQLEQEASKSKDLLKKQEERSKQQTILYEKLKGDHERLKTMIQQYLDTMEFLRGEKQCNGMETKSSSNTIPHMELLYQQLSELQEKMKRQQAKVEGNQSERNNPVPGVVDFFRRINPTDRPRECQAASGCVAPLAVKPGSVPTPHSAPLHRPSNFVSISESDKSAFCHVKVSDRHLSGRENPTGERLFLVGKSDETDNFLENVSALNIVAKSHTPSSIELETTHKVFKEATDAQVVSVMSGNKQPTKMQKGIGVVKARVQEQETSKPTKQRTSLVVPHQSSKLKPPARSLPRKSVQAIEGTPARTSMDKSQRGIPRVASLSCPTKSRNFVRPIGSSVKSTQNIPRGTISEDRIPTSKARAGLSKPSSSKVSSKCGTQPPYQARRVNQSGVPPPRRSSHIPLGKQTKISGLVERSTPLLSRARKMSSSSSISRTGHRIPTTMPKGTSTTKISNGTPERLREQQNVSHSLLSMTPSLCVTPARTSGQDTGIPEPSSQQVHDKFSSLCSTWSTASKAKRDEASTVELPPSLKLDRCFDSSARPRSTPSSTMSKRRLALQRSLQGDKKAASMNNDMHSLSLDEFSAHDDSDDLLLSPLPQPVAKQSAPDLNILKSIIFAQACVRSFLARNAYNRNKKQNQATADKATLIQSVVRRMLAKCAMQRRKSSALTITRFVRSSLFRRAAFRASVQIQSHWRRFVDARQHSKSLKAVTKIQSFFRCVHAFKTLQEYKRLHIRKTTAILLPSQWSSATLIQNEWRKRMCMIHLTQRKTSVLKLQKSFRFYLSQKRLRAAHDAHARAATLIQRQVKRFAAKQRIEKIRKAVTAIQSRQRGRSTRREMLSLVAATIKVQSQWRRKSALISYTEAIRDVVACQALIRAYQTSKKMKDMKRSVICLQCVVRGYIQRNYRVALTKASIKVQSQWRSHRARQIRSRQALILIGHQQRAILKIQEWLRSVQARTSYCVKRAAVIRIQSVYRAFGRSSEFKKFRRVVVILQSFMRSRLATKHLGQTIQSVIVVQKQWRRHSAREKSCVRLQTWTRKVQASRRYREQKRAVIQIQASWRATGEKRFQIARVGIIKLQGLFRTRRVSDQFRISRRNVIIIQSIVRAKMQIANYLAIRLHVTRLQKVSRGHADRRRFLRFKKGIVSLQNRWRRHRINVQEKKERALVVIQTFYRAHSSRSLFLSKRVSIISIQKIARGALIHKKFSILRKGAVQLQLTFRGKLARRQVSNRRDQVSHLQRWARGRIERQRHLELKRAAIAVQKTWRCYAGVLKLEKQTEALETLQSWFRTCIARSFYRRKLNRVAKLQSLWRSISAATQYKKTRYCAIKFQSFWRSKYVFHQYTVKKISAILIQSVCRGYWVRKSLATKKGAATTIQAAWRRTSCYGAFQRKVDCIVLLQSWLRTRLETTRYNCLQLAVRTLQRACRSHKERKLRNVKSKAACTVQTIWRKWHAQDLYKSTRKVAVFLQRIVRGIQSRKRIHCEWNAAIMIQSKWRHVCVLCKMRSEQKAVMAIQARVRGFLARKSFAKRLVKVKCSSKSERHPHHEPATPAQKRAPLTCLRNKTPATMEGRQSLTHMSKGQERRPLRNASSARKPFGDVSSVFSPMKTRGLKRGHAPQDQENMANIAPEGKPSPKRRKSEVSKPIQVVYPRPDHMKVVELREALQRLGVRPKDIRKVRKAQLITMLEKIQQGTRIETAVASLT